MTAELKLPFLALPKPIINANKSIFTLFSKRFRAVISIKRRLSGSDQFVPSRALQSLNTIGGDADGNRDNWVLNLFTLTFKCRLHIRHLKNGKNAICRFT